jgi:NAD(P)-dependent dehydrogenase (short-subunit alcohol dehydrogenase family)
MTDQISFDGQVALVTGGGQGLGRGYCLDLARRGAAIVVNDISREAADDVVGAIQEDGGRAVASYDSVSTPDGGRAIVQRALDEFGTVDVVINNAGFLRNGYFEDLTVEQIDAVLDVHVRGAFFVTQPAWSVMREKGYGRLILTSSAGGMLALQGQANYATAKAALYGLCKALAFEGGEHGICVNTVLPMTLGATNIAANNPIPDWAKYWDAEARAKLDGREGVEPVVPLVTFLASNACALNGEAFSAVGGRFARVFVGITPGWLAQDAHAVSAEDIADQVGPIRDLDGFTVPVSLYDEVAEVAAAVSSLERA